MSSYTRLLLDAITFSEYYKPPSSSYSYHYEDTSDKTVRIGVPIFALYSLFSSSAPPMIIESKSIGVTNKTLPKILLENAPTFQFTRKFVLLTPSLEVTTSADVRSKFGNLRELVISCPELQFGDFISLLRLCSLRLETLSLSTVNNEVLKQALIDLPFPCLDHLALQRDGHNLSNDLLVQVIKKLRRTLQSLSLSCRGLSYGARLAAEPTFSLDSVLQAFCPDQEEGNSITSDKKRNIININEKIRSITINAMRHRVGRQALAKLSAACPCLHTFNIDSLLALEKMAPSVTNPDDLKSLQENYEAPLDGLIRYDDLTEVPCTLRVLNIQNTGSNSILNLSGDFCKYVVSNLVRLSILASSIDIFLKKSTSTESNEQNNNNNLSSPPPSMATIYENAYHLETLELMRMKGVTFADLCLDKLHLAKRLQNLVLTPVDDNFDTALPRICNDLEYPPAAQVKSLSISGFRHDSSASWIPCFAPNLEELTIHIYGFDTNLYKNIANSLHLTLKHLTVDTEESPRAEIFEEIAKCSKLETLRIEGACESQMSDNPECLKALRKINRSLRSFDLASCEVKEKVMYEMIYGE